ncbi:glycosyltransferase family 2 protein [Mesobaculum littorinae]|uniref:Glycosyltransferase family 2 protein n=1 Tax=Mesobaculum littorinae TaxID=2486419 RepID=A0A438AGN6_9RHOB|nr:glycosyltransferase family 2 protein [Mesobaculum littorinae]RVV97862.1 glycosyltransferase family 2 protein [Mesobaculum littorinae]
MGLVDAYKLRVRRRVRLIRAFRKRRELTSVADRTAEVRPGDTLLFATLRNERIRLPYFLAYYRAMGIQHFFFVDNGSDDGSADYLAQQGDVSLWHTRKSYRKARFGMDWMNWLLRRYAHGHWALTVDVDEFLVFPFCDTRPIQALTDWLDASQVRALGTLLLDMYPKGPLTRQPYREGADPFATASWFDSGNYMISKNWDTWNLWIQGGPRARVFFADRPDQAPALNKIPLVKWHRSYAYISSTHMLLPRGLNLVYDMAGGEKTSGCLLHAKFLDTITGKAAEELKRGEHYAGSREYKAYDKRVREDPDLWCKWSEKYINWRQLEILGLMSTGNWA